MEETRRDDEAGREAAERMHPGPEHGVLSVFVGIWDTEVAFWPHPGRDPHRSSGVMITEWVLGGRYLMERYDGRGGSFQGHGYRGFNRGADIYESFWIDTGSTAMQSARGHYEAAARAFTMLGTYLDPMTGQARVRRTRIQIVADDEYFIEDYVDDAGGHPRRVMEIVCRRAGRVAA